MGSTARSAHRRPARRARLAGRARSRARPADDRRAALVRTVALPLGGVPLGRRQRRGRRRVALAVLPRGARLRCPGAVYRGDLHAADTAARAAFAAARPLAPIAARRPLEALGDVAIFRGELDRAASLYGRARDLSAGAGDHLDAAWDAASAAAALGYGNRLDEAHRLARQAQDAAEASGAPSALALAAWVMGEITAGTDPGQAGPTCCGRSASPYPRATAWSPGSPRSHWRHCTPGTETRLPRCATTSRSFPSGGRPGRGRPSGLPSGP